MKIKISSFVDKVVGVIVGGNNNFDRLVNKIIFYGKRRNLSNLLEKSISSLVGKILFLHTDLDFVVKSEPIKGFTFSKKTIDLDDYVDSKGYKIILKVSMKLQTTNRRYIDFIIEKDNSVLFDERIRVRQDCKILNCRKSSRISTDCALDIINLFDTIGVDSLEYFSIRDFKNAS